MEQDQLAQARVAFKRAVFIMGNQSKMAELLGITRQAVSHRMTGRIAAPVQTVEELRLIEEATGIKPHDLRPDLYPLENPSPLAQHPAGQPPASAPRAPLSEEAGGSSSADPLGGLAA